MKRKPSLFAFEGPDGVGKSTIVAMAAGILRARGYETVEGTFPGNSAGTLGKLVYDLHHNPNAFGLASVLPESLQLMHVAAHIDAISGWIGRARASTKVVLLDRFWWSTAAYGAAAGISQSTIDAILAVELRYWRAEPPDAVFFLERHQGSRESNKNLESAYVRLAIAELPLTRVIRVQNNTDITTVSNTVVEEIEALSAC